MTATSASLEIQALPAFEDNYLWLLRQANHAVVVDPGDAEVVARALQTQQLQLAAILLTHHHADHTGGALALQRHWQCPVYAPQSQHAAYQGLEISHVQDGDSLPLPMLEGRHAQVIALPGHTLDHLAYWIDHTHLFSGDVLFSAGCGRLFEGTPAQMYASLQTLARLPGDTLIYPAHEYTTKNLEFALTIEPENPALLQRNLEVRSLRAQGQPSLPTRLRQELQFNPFLRCQQLTSLPQYQGLTPVELFAQIRAQRNSF